MTMTKATHEAIRQEIANTRAAIVAQEPIVALAAIACALDLLTRDEIPVEPARGWRPDAVVWRCINPGCNKVLGLVAPGALKVRHMRREIESEGTHHRQICDDCQTENYWPPVRRDVL